VFQTILTRDLLIVLGSYRRRVSIITYEARRFVSSGGRGCERRRKWST
jgi:hypothetical protein